ncbi:tRNA (adenosine(37)-N6)-dimethylallyltransferase MiaA [Brevundimonas sp. 2R-24]|uniref:tRNA dimethylallyltransferase n=1 Tax=Peiella sedimenti TaxID=3061083 RepID=A0ABT8SN20_9CAUL|nr:tRNA (adenosine(37)-N6)-dimethylallyltransferase MiaA [Caulobacteraceae bacterium XZ-24]
MGEPLITLLAGPTASGKSALALEWAERSGAVILNADSQQLYADLRVLTARPSPEDEARAEHRLYGVADAAEAWSVGRWARAVTPELAALRTEGRPAIVVGGTGLYFTALTRGLAEVPPVPDAVRDAISDRFAAEGEAAFRARLSQVDPEAEARILPGDRQRLLRALSVFEASGRSLSAWQGDTRPLLPQDSYDARLLLPDRADLYARCDARAAVMLERGAPEEVEALLTRRLDPALPCMKAVGVREIGDFLGGRATRVEALDRLAQATRNYAKRQYTWFRNVQSGLWRPAA